MSTPTAARRYLLSDAEARITRAALLIYALQAHEAATALPDSPYVEEWEAAATRARRVAALLAHTLGEPQ